MIPRLVECANNLFSIIHEHISRLKEVFKRRRKANLKIHGSSLPWSFDTKKLCKTQSNEI